MWGNCEGRRDAPPLASWVDLKALRSNAFKMILGSGLGSKRHFFTKLGLTMQCGFQVIFA